LELVETRAERVEIARLRMAWRDVDKIRMREFKEVT